MLDARGKIQHFFGNYRPDFATNETAFLLGTLVQGNRHRRIGADKMAGWAGPEIRRNYPSWNELVPISSSCRTSPQSAPISVLEVYLAIALVRSRPCRARPSFVARDDI